MKQYIVQVPDNKAGYLLEMLRSLRFVKTKEVEQKAVTPEKDAKATTIMPPGKRKWRNLGSQDFHGKLDNVNLRDFAHE